jgi:hypothetical protein
MSIDVQSEVQGDYLRVNATGQYSFEFLFDFIAHVKAEADKAEKQRVLIDCRNLSGGMAEFERFHGGMRIAEVFGRGLKAALIMQPQNVTKLGELVAVNRGARFLVSDSEPEAIDWLLADL